MTFLSFTAALAVVAALHLPSWHYVSSTCYAQAGITASGAHTFVGEVAMNAVPLGTHIELSRRVFGRRRFVVLDRIGSGSELDVFNPSERACIDYGRQRIGYVVTGAIVSIQLPGDQRKNSEKYLRAVTEDTRVETIRKAVTAMMKKPSDFEIGNRAADPFGRRKATVRVIKGDEDERTQEQLDELVASAID